MLQTQLPTRTITQPEKSMSMHPNIVSRQGKVTATHPDNARHPALAVASHSAALHLPLKCESSKCGSSRIQIPAETTQPHNHR